MGPKITTLLLGSLNMPFMIDLEMKLKVTKMFVMGQLCSLYGVMMMMNDLSQLSCVFLISDAGC